VDWKSWRYVHTKSCGRRRTCNHQIPSLQLLLFKPAEKGLIIMNKWIILRNLKISTHYTVFHLSTITITKFRLRIRSLKYFWSKIIYTKPNIPTHTVTILILKIKMTVKISCFLKKTPSRHKKKILF
jgi:hypothetical protein